MKKLAGLLAIPLLVACATGAPSETDGATSRTSSHAAVPPSTERAGGGTIGEMQQQMIDAVVEQAADDTGVREDAIGVITAEAVMWSDGSIGCPREGMVYTQALVPGYRVILDVAGEEIHYHAGSDGQFFPCGEPQPAAGGATSDD